jgi:hypothetical protein
MKKQALFVITIFIFSFTNIFAQAVQNLKESSQNEKQIRNGMTTLERDKAELKAFNTSIFRLQSAFEDRDVQSAQILKKELVESMQREIDQSVLKMKQAQNEVRQSKQELASDQRELRKDRQDARDTKIDRKDDRRDYSRDKVNKLDDRVDLRDDIRDAHNVGNRIQQQRKILDEIRSFQYSNTSKLEKTKEVLTLLNQFSGSMKADVFAVYKEIMEDKTERREDARERRDDRRERAEKSRN